jgi:hypothetical protein
MKSCFGQWRRSSANYHQPSEADAREFSHELRTCLADQPSARVPEVPPLTGINADRLSIPEHR